MHYDHFKPKSYLKLIKKIRIFRRWTVSFKDAAEKLFCCDPYKRHKKRIFNALGQALHNLKRLVNDARLAIGDVLCNNCRCRLEKDPCSLPPQEEGASSSEHDRSLEEAAPSRSTASSVSDAEISRQDADQVMPLLGLSPLLRPSKYMPQCHIPAHRVFFWLPLRGNSAMFIKMRLWFYYATFECVVFVQ